MAALTRSRDTKVRKGQDFVFGAGGPVFQGGMVCMSAGGKVVAAHSAGKVVVGVAQKNAIMGCDVEVSRGVFCFANHTADAVELSDVGLACYVFDDQSVQKTAGSAPLAGIVFDVDALGVWVKI